MLAMDHKSSTRVSAFEEAWITEAATESWSYMILKNTIEEDPYYDIVV